MLYLARPQYISIHIALWCQIQGFQVQMNFFIPVNNTISDAFHQFSVKSKQNEEIPIGLVNEILLGEEI